MSLLINHFYRFGEFTLDADQKVLLREGKPVPLTPKVLDTLLILVQNSGQIIERDDLMTRLWPETFVEEANLNFNITQLRKSLNDDAPQPLYIETVARRGYRFIADVEEVLINTSPRGNHVAQRFEISAGQSPSDASGFSRWFEAVKLESSGELTAGAENNLPARSEPVAVVSKRAVAFAAAIVIVVAGAGLSRWKFSNRSSGSYKRIDNKSTASSPLKLEKLTQTGQSRHVAISPDAKYIAYTRHAKNKSTIWLRQLATNTNVEIVPETSAVYGLAFANSGEFVYFARRDPNALYRVSVLGGVPTKIVDNPEGNFSISADDSQIAFIRKATNQDGVQEYSLIVSDGAQERTLLVENYPNKLDAPLWTSDNQSIICARGLSVSGGQDVIIVEVRVDDGTKKELCPDRFFHIAKIAWLPDKTGLIMCARKELGDNNQLWRISYPAMEISQITEDLIDYLDLSVAAGVAKIAASQSTRISDIWVGSSSEPRSLKKINQAIDNFCWTPDGRLVYSSTASGNRDLWIMQPNGTEQRQLTINTAVDGNPAVTLDNRYIVFISDRTGAFQVWRMNLDGSNQIQLTSGAGKDHPAVSTDGKWVLYNTTGDWHLWKVSIDGGEPARVTEQPALCAAVSPDGRMIACVGGELVNNKLPILVLPFEGGQPLNRFDLNADNSKDFRCQWTPASKALIFGVKHNGMTALFKQQLDGHQPEKIADLNEDELSDFGYSFDGKSFAVTRGGWQHDIVLISGLNQY